MSEKIQCCTVCLKKLTDEHLVIKEDYGSDSYNYYPFCCDLCVNVWLSVKYVQTSVIPQYLNEEKF
jgi:hypothetical protein